MTKLYLSKTGVGYVPATLRGAWDNSASHVVRGLHTLQDQEGSPLSLTIAETSSTTDYDVLMVRAISAPLAADCNFSGTVDLTLGVQESIADADMAYHLHVFVTQGNTDNVRGTLLDNYVDDSSNEWGTSASAKGLASAQNLNAVSALAGDRIVVELGFRARNTTASTRSGTLWYAGNGSDLVRGTVPTTGVGYLDFSDSFSLVNNPVVRVSQVALETLSRPINSNARITQIPIEVLRHPVSSNVRVSQLAVEVIRRNGSPPAATQGGMLIIVAG